MHVTDRLLECFCLNVLFFCFCDSAFEDETLRLRQLKLDNQVSRSSRRPSWLELVVSALKSRQGLTERLDGQDRLWLLIKQGLNLVAKPEVWAVAGAGQFDDGSN